LLGSTGCASEGPVDRPIAIELPVGLVPVDLLPENCATGTVSIGLRDLGGPQGETAFVHPGRTAREPREQRLSVLRAKQVLRSMELLARHVIPRFAGA